MADSFLVSKMRFFIVIFLVFVHANIQAMTEVEALIGKGSGCNNYLLYEEALEPLNKAIKLDPNAKEAYKERAFSYFELNRLDLALNDYYQVVQPNKHNRYSTAQSLPIVFCSLNEPFSLDFAKGVLQGTLHGGTEGTFEFASSIRGGLTFLWSFACSPYDVSKELMEALYDMGELIADGGFLYLIDASVPEVMECRKHWRTWSEHTKGQKIGFIVGKYGIMVFYEITTFKGGVYLFNKLKRANIMAILERYAATKSARILEESAKHAQKNSAIIKRAASGAIIPHNPNVLPHVFAKKHQWDKYFKVTGDYEKDFEKLAKFLQEENIFLCRREENFLFVGGVTYKYTKTIGKETIVAIFEVNKRNVPLLRNAWVQMETPYK